MTREYEEHRDSPGAFARAKVNAELASLREGGCVSDDHLHLSAIRELRHDAEKLRNRAWNWTGDPVLKELLEQVCAALDAYAPRRFTPTPSGGSGEEVA